MLHTMAAASKKTTAAEPQRAKAASSQKGICTMPFAVAQTAKYPTKCTAHPPAAMNLHRTRVCLFNARSVFCFCLQSHRG